MSVIPIYNCFHPVLKQKTEPVSEFNQELVQLSKNMYETLYNISNGVGLAANQVGKSISMYIVDLNVGEKESKKKYEPVTFINPEIIAYSDEENDYQEGCLSIPEFYENVRRPQAVEVKYFDLDMKEQVREFDGFMARVIQHEQDHLDGILMFERISKLKRTLSKSKLNRIMRGDIKPNYPMVQPDGKLYLPDLDK